MEKEVEIYCDGACLGNPGTGGYAALLILKSTGQEKVVSGSELNTTNNRMELKAAIMGLRALKKKCRVTLYSDSQYLVKGMTQWLENWLKNNFRAANKKPVLNEDLWRELWNLSKLHAIKWQWVKGHAGNENNERVDEIAKEQAALLMHENL